MPVVQWIEHLVAVQAVGGSIPLGHARRVRIEANCASFENSREQSLHRFESCTLRLSFAEAATADKSAKIVKAR